MLDVNDFDETLPGPWEWDDKRLAASLEAAGRDNGYSGKERRGIVTAAITRYREAMRTFAGMGDLDVWYAHADLDQVRADFESQMKKRQRKLTGKALAKARTHDSMQELAKLTRTVDGRPRIISDPPLPVPITDLLPDQMDQAAFQAQIQHLLSSYRRTLETDRKFLLEQFEFADMARKVVRVGSVGTRCWIILMLGRDESDPLFLQIKEAEESVLSRFVGASQYRNQGQRVVAGQRLMQASSDIFLGWQRTEAGLDRSGDRIAIAAYLGGSDVFDTAIAEFAAAYADQNERDYKALVDAIAAGRITAESDKYYSRWLMAELSGTRSPDRNVFTEVYESGKS